MNKMTERQKKFANEYVKTRNATQSALNAGYSDKTAHRTGQENMQKPAIREFINNRLKAVEETDIFDGDRIIKELLSIGYGKSYDEIPLLVGEGVQETVKIRTPDATRRSALNDAYKLVKASGRDELLTKKLELEIKKLEKELESTETTEDKMADVLDKLDGLVDKDDS